MSARLGLIFLLKPPSNHLKPRNGRLSVNGQDSKYVRICFQMVSVVATQLCCCSVETAIDSSK